MLEHKRTPEDFAALPLTRRELRSLNRRSFGEWLLLSRSALVWLTIAQALVMGCAAALGVFCFVMAFGGLR